MRKPIAAFIALLTLQALPPLLVAAAAAPKGAMHKCTVNGKVSYQQAPCPVTQPAGVAREPTLEELNAREKERRAAMPAAKRPSPPLSAGPAGASSPPEPVRPVAQPAASFRCDGRTHCSQMRSCEEAKFFLANCPGVAMDGDNNGIPCERQFCASR